MRDFLNFEGIDVQFGYDEGDLWFFSSFVEVTSSSVARIGEVGVGPL